MLARTRAAAVGTAPHRRRERAGSSTVRVARGGIGAALEKQRHLRCFVAEPGEGGRNEDVSAMPLFLVRDTAR